MIFEITKEGRMHTGISSAVCEKKRLKRVPVSCAWLENVVHTKVPDVSDEAEKMIWPSEYRSMADAYGAARRRRT